MHHERMNQDRTFDIDELVDEILCVAKDPRVEDLLPSVRQGRPSFANRRLVTDYISADRGVMSRPSKQGRKSIYRFRHVMEFLAAKRMLKKKWPIEEIGGALRDLNLEELSAFVFGDNSVGERIELKRKALLLKTLRGAGEAATTLGQPLYEQVTLIVVETWCQLLVESRALAHVTKDQAKAIGSRVEQLLLDQGIREQAAGK